MYSPAEADTVANDAVAAEEAAVDAMAFWIPVSTEVLVALAASLETTDVDVVANGVKDEAAAAEEEGMAGKELE